MDPSEPHRLLSVLGGLAAAPKSMGEAIIEVVRMMQEERVGGRSAYSCLMEVRAWLRDLCSESSEETFDLLEEVADLLVHPLSKDGEEEKGRVKDGVARALELVPQVIECLDKLSELEEEEKLAKCCRVRNNLVDSLLRASHENSMLSMGNILLEVNLTQDEQHRLCKKIERVSLEGEERSMVATLQFVMAACQKFHRPCWMSLVRNLMAKSPPSTLDDMYCVLGMSLDVNSLSFLLLLELYDETSSVDEHDLLLLLFCARNDLCRDLMLHRICAMLAKQLGREEKAQEGGEGARAARRMMSEVTRRSEASWLSSLLLELSSLLMHLSPAAAGLAVHLLLDMFHWQPSCRPELLAHCFSSLLEFASSPLVLSSYVKALRRLAGSYLLSLRDLQEEVAQGFSLLWMLPLNPGKSVMAAFMPLCRSAPSLVAKVALMVRKEMLSSEARRVSLAVFGQLSLLSCGALEEESEQLDAILSFKSKFSSSSSSIRQELYSGIRRILGGLQASGQRGDARLRLHASARTLIESVLLERLSRFFCSTGERRCGEEEEGRGRGGERRRRGRFQLLRCFQVVRTNSTRMVRTRDDVAGLLSCALQLLLLHREETGGRTEGEEGTRIEMLLEELVRQVTDNRCVADLLMESGHVRDEEEGREKRRRDEEENLASPAERLPLLLSIYEVLLEFSSSPLFPPDWILDSRSLAEAPAVSSPTTVLISFFCAMSAILPMIRRRDGGKPVAQSYRRSRPASPLPTSPRPAADAKLARARGGEEERSLQDRLVLDPHGALDTLESIIRASLSSSSSSSAPRGGSRHLLVVTERIISRLVATAARPREEGGCDMTEEAGGEQAGSSRAVPQQSLWVSLLPRLVHAVCEVYELEETLAERGGRRTKMPAGDEEEEEEEMRLEKDVKETLRARGLVLEDVADSRGGRRGGGGGGAALSAMRFFLEFEGCGEQRVALLLEGLRRAKASERIEGAEASRKKRRIVKDSEVSSLDLVLEMVERLERWGKEGGGGARSPSRLLQHLEFCQAVLATPQAREEGRKNATRADKLRDLSKRVVLLLRIASVEHAKLVRSAMALAMSLVPDEERVVFALQALRRVSVGEEEEEERCDQELLWGSLEEPFRSARTAEEIAALRWDLPKFDQIACVNALLTVVLPSLIPVMSRRTLADIFQRVLEDGASTSSVQQQLRSCSDCFCAVSFATCGLSRFVSSSSAVRASVMRIHNVACQLLRDFSSLTSLKAGDQLASSSFLRLARHVIGGSGSLISDLQLSGQEEQAARASYQLEKAVASVRTLCGMLGRSRSLQVELERLLEASALPPPPKSKDEDARASEQVKRRKRPHRLRSRNAYVDAFLEEEDGLDSYADLEDFIVCDE